MEDLISQMGDIFTAVLGWIPSVLTMAISQPIILFFIGFALVGVVIRWARRLVHFA